MADEKVTDLAVMIAFSAAMVALGANELRQIYLRHTDTVLSQEQIVRELRGDLDENHIGFTREAAQNVEQRDVQVENKESYENKMLELLGIEEK
jgi:hypothetical protein